MGNSTFELAYPCLFHIALHKNAKVAEILSPRSNGSLWNLLFTCDPYEWEIPLVGNLVEGLKLVYISSKNEDSLIWSPSPDGSFSSNLFLFVLIGNNSSQS